jgi:hypothetical protein
MPRKANRQEAINRLDQVTSEIRNVKDQQFRTLYYSLLLYSAVIALYQIQVYFPHILFVTLKILTIAVVVGVCRQSCQMQWDHFRALQEYREGLDQVEAALSASPPSPKKTSAGRASVLDWVLFVLLGREKPGSKPILTAKDKLASGKRYTWTFIALTLLGFVCTVTALIFDQ